MILEQWRKVLGDGPALDRRIAYVLGVHRSQVHRWQVAGRATDLAELTLHVLEKVPRRHWPDGLRDRFDEVYCKPKQSAAA